MPSEIHQKVVSLRECILNINIFLSFVLLISNFGDRILIFILQLREILLTKERDMWDYSMFSSKRSIAAKHVIKINVPCTSYSKIKQFFIPFQVNWVNRSYNIRFCTHYKNKIENNSTWEGEFNQSKWVKIN